MRLPKEVMTWRLWGCQFLITVVKRGPSANGHGAHADQGEQENMLAERVQEV
jgi:hypothetical protein